MRLSFPRSASALAIAAAVSVLPASAAAEPELAWDARWPRFSVVEYATTGTLIAGMGVFILSGEASAPRWQGPILFDEALRDALRGNTSDVRGTAQVVGDALYYGSLAYPYLVDVVAVTWLWRDSPDVAGQMALINTEAFAISGFLSYLSNATFRRERPSLRECDEGKPDPVFPGCEDTGPFESFYSGHTSIAFSSAALTCMHHAYLPLYGRSPVGGTIACVASMTGATAVSALRIVADQHYASDVIAGSAVGLASGLLVPWFHYRGGAAPAAVESATKPALGFVLPLLTPTSVGAFAGGHF